MKFVDFTKQERSYDFAMCKWLMAAILFLPLTAGFAQKDISAELENATPEYITDIYGKALQAFANNDYEGSLRYIRHVIKTNFQDFRLRMLAAHCHWRLGNFESAAIHFRALALISPENSATYTSYASMLLEQGQFSKAANLLKKGEGTLNQAHVRIPVRFLNLQARAALLQKQYAEALKLTSLAKAAFSVDEDTQGDRLQSLTLEGRSLLATGQFDKAVFTLEWALSLEPKSTYNQNLLGVAYMLWSKTGSDTEKKEKRDRAHTFFEQVLKSDAPPSLKNIVQKNLGQLGA